MTRNESTVTTITIGIATFLLTVAGLVLLLNLSLGNKPIDDRIETEFCGNPVRSTPAGATYD